MEPQIHADTRGWNILHVNVVYGEKELIDFLCVLRDLCGLRSFDFICVYRRLSAANEFVLYY
jgi:hypothetical protein